MSDTLKRFNLATVHPAGQQPRGTMIENSDGEYIAYEDHTRILASHPKAEKGDETEALREAVRGHLKWFERFICDENELNSSTPRKVAQNAQVAAVLLRAALGEGDAS